MRTFGGIQWRSTVLFCGFGMLTTFVNGQISTTGLTSCAASCVNKYVSSSTCSSSDVQCICTTSNVLYNIDYCLGSNCPTADWTAAFNAESDFCYGDLLSSTFDYSSYFSDMTATDVATAPHTTHTGINGVNGSTKGGSVPIKNNQAGLSLGAKIGIAIAVILLVLIGATIAVVLICLRKRKNKQIPPGGVTMDEKNVGLNSGAAHAMGAIPMEAGAAKPQTIVTTSALPSNASDGYSYVDANGHPIQMAYTPSPAPPYPAGTEYPQHQQYQQGAMWGVPASALAAGAVGGAAAGTAAYFATQHHQAPQPTGSPSPHAMSAVPYQPSTTPHPAGPPPSMSPQPSIPPSTATNASPQLTGMGVNPQPAGPPPGFMTAPHAGAVELPLQAEHINPMNNHGSPGSVISAGGQPLAFQPDQAPGSVVSGQVFEMGESNGHHVVQSTPPRHPGAPYTMQHIVPNDSGAQGPIELAGSS